MRKFEQNIWERIWIMEVTFDFVNKLTVAVCVFLEVLFSRVLLICSFFAVANKLGSTT